METAAQPDLDIETVGRLGVWRLETGRQDRRR